MFPRSVSLLCVVVSVGGLLPVGVASADFIRFSNQSQPGHSDRTGGWSVTVDSGFDPSSGLTPDYDAGIDGLMNTSTKTDPYFFVAYFAMGTGQGGAGAVDLNKTYYPHIGDSYTVRLSFENRPGRYINTPNCIRFDTLTIDNPNGVTDYAYSLSVSTYWHGPRDHFESGLVSEIMATSEQRTAYWNQRIPEGADWRNGSYYGELTLTAVSNNVVPAPSSLACLIGVGVTFGGMQWWKKRRLQRRAKATV